jgi:manganese transport system ATP-binding protein
MNPSASPSAAVVARDLELAHGQHVAVAGGSFELAAGSLVAVIGPNGSGKSTVLDAIAGLMPVRAGRLEVGGPGVRRSEVAYVLQSTEVPPHLPLTVREVVTMGRYGRTGLWGRLGHAGRVAVRRSMERVEITALADRQVLELSGGQRQRALVAQGLCAGAEVLLLDEPMTALDVVSQRLVRSALDEERGLGRTVVFSTHDLAEAARADLVVLLAGRVVASGPPEEVLTDRHLTEAYRGHIVGVGGVTILDDPHHHGPREERHDGHDHG